MLRITKEGSHGYMSPDIEPKAHCESGDTVLFEAPDCYDGLLKSESDRYSEILTVENPVSGPLYINGAEKGDVLKIDILKIEVANQGVQAMKPNGGPLGKYIDEEYSKIIPIKDGQVMFNDKIHIPLLPMIGTIGTAPEHGSVDTMTPGEHGANMDCKKIQEGTTLYLPVNTPGALLQIGDVHGVMGDGEVALDALEVEAEVTVRVTVCKNLPIPTPMVESEDEYVTIASAQTMDEAAVLACDKMYHFLGYMTDINEKDRIALLSLVGDLGICQVVDPLMTARMTVPKWIFENYDIHEV